MRKIVILIILSLTIQCSFGQACGIYRIKYVGKIQSNSFKIEKIKLPTIKFLHGLENENSKNSSVEIELTNNQFLIELRSHLTSIYENAEDLLRFYKEKREGIPIIFLVIVNGKKKEIQTELTWDNIQITMVKDDKFGNLFELNLNEIDLENDTLKEEYPWDSVVTKVALNAIHLSINNFVNEVKDENFPSSPGPFNVPFRQKEITEFEIIGYSYSETNPHIYQIEFRPSNQTGSGNRITVVMNIKTKEALKVYMQADG
ncbi:hypothetical protein [Dokdonia sp.]|uniref:hypothetical protein n=1 Tax=Dokdonia sp. TaxID=2024995 RepID=UPI003264EB44